MRRAINLIAFASFRPPALLRPAVELHLLKRLGIRISRFDTRLRWIDDAPIWTKACAASAVLLLCLIGLGLNAYLAFNRSSISLLHHSEVELPKQRAASKLMGGMTATHLKIFRYVTWTQIGVGADSAEIFTELKALGKRFQEVDLLSADTERTTLLSKKWDQYSREISAVVAAAATDPSMASMLLANTDDEFRSIAAELQQRLNLVADQTTTTSKHFATEARWNRNVLALGGALGVLISTAVMLLVGRSIIAPIRSITRAMQDVPAEHVRINADYRNRKDEIGQMVQAIALFRQTLGRHEEKLQAQNLQLDAALSNMVQGLCMFDAEQRIVIANARYAEMYGLTVEQVKPGTTFREILQHRIRGGQYGAKNVDDVLAGIRNHIPERGSGHYLSELADGRCIAVSVQSMTDGGTVTTHQDITEQRRSEEKIAHLALHDSLTGLPNRALLNERLEHAVARANGGEIVAVHLIDLDLFKNVNDTLGHAAGDKLLSLVTSRLRRMVRESDTIARMGGDEFAIVHIAISGPADATSLAHRIIEAVSAPYEIDGHQVVIGASIGIAVGPDNGLTHHDLMRNADLALYRAKADGRGTFRFFEPEMDAQVQARRALENDLRKAIPAGEFELHYQPVIDLASNDICGFEALIRWHHPKKGMVAPNTFIPLAEEIGLIIPMGEWVIRQACAAAAQWPDHLRVAVNLSSVQFRSPGLVEVIISALATSGLAAEQLELEITETVLLQNNESTLTTLYRLRELGVRIALDDFGTGYSSLSYLQSFPFDKIKIDRCFVKDITERTGSLNIVQAVAALAKGLGMAATAEGVETQAQLDTIASAGCTEMQGFLFSRPLPAQEIERLFLSQRRQVGLRLNVTAG